MTLTPRQSLFRLLPALLMASLLAGCGNDSGHTNLISTWGSSSIANGGITVDHGKVALHRDGLPEAGITEAGELDIAGKPVTLDPTQRDRVKRYYQAAVAVRDHGIATGKAGAALAGESIKGAVASIASGDSDKIEKQVEDGSQKVTREAMKICQDLADIKSAQDSLAGTLPAFKPYAGIIDADAVTDCRKNDDDK